VEGDVDRGESTTTNVVSRRFLLGPSLVVTALVLAAAVSFTLARDRLTGFATRFYGSTDHVLYPFLAARVVGYRSFLWALLGILVGWCLVLWVDPGSSRRETTVVPRWSAHLPWTGAFLATAIIAVLLSNREWVRFGRPCWDNYCLYSELIFSWLRRPSSGTWAALHAFMRTDYHANSPFVPVLVAGTKLASGMDIIQSYRSLCAAATVLGLVVLSRFLRRRLSLPTGGAAAIILLLVSNIVVIRCCCFPQTDAFIFLWVALSLTRSFVFMERPTVARAVGCFAILTSGLFIKLSFLPALALIPLWTGLEPLFLRRSFSRETARTFALRVAVFVVGPLVVYLVFQVALGLLGMYGREFSRMQTDDAVPLFHLISLVHVGAILIPLIVIGARRLTPSDCCMLAWTGLYLLSLWIGRTSGWDRFYLAILPPLAIVSRHGIRVVRERLSVTTASIGAGLYAVANYCALLFNLYQ
jgi:hypothetical protein